MTKHDYFQNKLQDYAAYRPRLPEVLCNYLSQYVGDKHHQELLDIACGSGQLTIPLSYYFTEVAGVDCSMEMLQYAKSAAAKAGQENISWHNLSAEELPASWEDFDLITIANAFHWLDHSKVIPWVITHLRPGGVLSLIGSYESFFVNAYDKVWLDKVVAVWEQWFGARRQEILGQRFSGYNEWAEVLSKYNFNQVEYQRLPHRRTWTIEQIIGFSRSLSFYQVESAAEADGFAQSMRDALMQLNPSGQFVEDYYISLVLAR